MVLSLQPDAKYAGLHNPGLKGTNQTFWNDRIRTGKQHLMGVSYLGIEFMMNI